MPPSASPFHAAKQPARADWSQLPATIAVLSAVAYITFAPPIALGQRIETSFFPILSHQEIASESVTRTDELLCWTWERDKERAPALLDIDVTLTTADGDAYAPEIFDPLNGKVWHTGGALPPGHYASRFCTAIPHDIPRSMPVRLKQRLTYNGFLDLWSIRVGLPSVIAE